MLDLLIELGFFSAKAIIIVALILLLIAGIVAILAHGKEKMGGKISIKNLNTCYSDVKQKLLEQILPKNAFKKFLKAEKNKSKNKDCDASSRNNIFVLDFNGDMKATAVSSLREEVTAILNIATPNDQVLIKLESAGGMVHAYGLAAAQLLRIREKNITLVVCVDKVAASGGYMMAAVANKIIAAPFAIIGSIGVIVQLPNFHRVLKDNHIDFEQITAGNFKRTLTLFGENTKEAREKLHQEIEEIHHLFKDLIHEYRKDIDIEKVSTGEHWLAKQAITLKLVDEIATSDDYLLSHSENSNLFEIKYHVKKSLTEKLFSAQARLTENLFKNHNLL